MLTACAPARFRDRPSVQDFSPLSVTGELVQDEDSDDTYSSDVFGRTVDIQQAVKEPGQLGGIGHTVSGRIGAEFRLRKISNSYPLGRWLEQASRPIKLR